MSPYDSKNGPRDLGVEGNRSGWDRAESLLSTGHRPSSIGTERALEDALISYLGAAVIVGEEEA